MAGVGFELKKLFRSRDGYLQNLKGFAVSAAVTQGPMLLNILMLLLMRFLLEEYGANESQQDWFLYTITYTTIFSLVFSNTVLMFVERYVSDCIYRKQEDQILSSFFALMLFLVGTGGLICVLYLRPAPRDALYKLVSTVQFGVMLIIWSEMSYLSAIKQYGKVLLGFLASVLVSCLLGVVLLHFTPLEQVNAALIATCAGYVTMMLLFFQQILAYYPGDGAKLYACLPALDHYKSLVVIGFFMALGLYAHNFVFWLSSMHNEIWAWGVFCTKYDIPTFFATLTVTPMLVMFVVAVETRVYRHYRAYFDSILYGGTLEDIELARHSLMQVIFREVSHMMEMQLFITIICATFLGNALAAVGLDAEQTAIYRNLCFGYCLYGLAKCLIILLLYFDDRAGALVCGAFFAVMSTVFSIITLPWEPVLWGLGYAAAAMLTSLLAALRLRSYLHKLEYKVFLRQPLFAPLDNGCFTRLALRLARAEDRMQARAENRRETRGRRAKGGNPP